MGAWRMEAGAASARLLAWKMIDRGVSREECLCLGPPQSIQQARGRVLAADTSVMPFVPSSNTTAPTMTVTEKDRT